MLFKRENYIYIILLIPAFLLGGFLHIVLYGVDFCDGICQIYYSILALVWGVTIKKRVTEKRIRKMLMITVGMMLLIFTLQMCRYKLLGDEMNAIRYAWYAYFIPVCFVPSLLFRIALYIGTIENEYPKKIQSICANIVAVLLSVMVMTNDIHQFVFKFSSGIREGYWDYTHGIGFYLIYVWVVFLYVVSLVIIIKKCKVMAIKKMVWIPLVSAIVGGIGEVLIIAGVLKFDGINIWQTGEFFFFWVLGFEEACIAIGLIPANIGYRRLLDFTNKPIIIADSSGKTVYKSPKAIGGINDNDNIQTFTGKICGGTVSWGVDMSVIYVLNHQIEETTEQIEMRNEYLHTENDLKAERSKIDARNNLYDSMANIVNTQIGKIKELLKNSDEAEFDENLREISVLNAYIKRRSNMELLRDDEDVLSLKELNTAISESCEYIKLCRAEALIAPVADAQLPAKMIILAYDFFETIVENSLESLKSLFATITYNKGQMKIRLLIDADSFEFDGGWRKDEIDEFSGKVTIAKEYDDTAITLLLNTGGAGL